MCRAALGACSTGLDGGAADELGVVLDDGEVVDGVDADHLGLQGGGRGGTREGSRVEVV